MIRTMRFLRHKHKISYVELGAAAQISTQRLSQIELNPFPSTAHHEELVRRAFLQVMEARKAALRDLEQDLHRYQDCLLEECREEDVL